MDKRTLLSLKKLLEADNISLKTKIITCSKIDNEINKKEDKNYKEYKKKKKKVKKHNKENIRMLQNQRSVAQDVSVCITLGHMRQKLHFVEYKIFECEKCGCWITIK